MNAERTIGLLGVPMDLGGGLRGVDMGPSALRIAGIERSVESLGLSFADHGNVPVPRPEARDPRDPKARFLTEIAHCCERLRRRVERMLEDGEFPLVVGGDHSVACGTVAALSAWYGRQDQEIGLVWVDAHADMNTPSTTESGNIHGMPLASALGYGPPELVNLGERVPMVRPENAVLVGIHSVDDRERELIHASGIHTFTMRDIDMLGAHEVMRRAIEIATDGTGGFHLSFDIDACDPSVAPGVGTPVPAGLTSREAHLVMEHAAESGKLLALELTEINPIEDVKNQTAEFARDLVLSALGKRVL